MYLCEMLWICIERSLLWVAKYKRTDSRDLTGPVGPCLPSATLIRNTVLQAGSSERGLR